jgi:hypothetical protein
VLSDWAIPLFSAMGGAAVGGLATLAGSVVINRREVVRGERIRLYLELIPALRSAVVGDWGSWALYAGPRVSELLDPVIRAWVLAGGTARELAKAINTTAQERPQIEEAWRALSVAERKNRSIETDLKEPLDGNQARTLTLIDELSRWLETKIL